MDIVAIRRELHKYSETAWTEIRTSARIAQLLNGMGYKEIKLGPEAVDVDAVVSAVRSSAEQRAGACARAVAQGADPAWVERTGGWPGVVATLNAGKAGPVLAFRFDIDALPYAESADAARTAIREGYASVNGSVHACGHDGHTAIGLAFAQELMRRKEELNAEVRLLFQPAEESYCGALSMIAAGHLSGVKHFFGMHISLSGDHKPLPSRSLGCGCDDFLGYCQLNVTFHGRASHPCGASQDGRNAILAACAATTAMHQIAPHEEGLFRINVGTISGGDCPNAIPAEARIEMEYRGETEAIMDYARLRVDEIIEGAAKTQGCTYSVEDLGVTPAAKSDPSLMDVVEAAAADVPWFEKLYRYANAGGSDDATLMMTEVQRQGGTATYFGLGADIDAPVHNEAFDFDEDVLDAAARLCMAITVRLSGR